MRIEAFRQLADFLDYWTLEVYPPAHDAAEQSTHGENTPAESWDELFPVEDTLHSSARKLAIHLEDEAWVLFPKKTR